MIGLAYVLPKICLVIKVENHSGRERLAGRAAVSGNAFSSLNFSWNKMPLHAQLIIYWIFFRVENFLWSNDRVVNVLVS